MEKKFEFKPFDRVLVRDGSELIWIADFFSHIEKEPRNGRLYNCISKRWRYCIPYEGNEHLLGTTDDYVELKKGDFVVARGGQDSHTYITILMGNKDGFISSYTAYDEDSGQTRVYASTFVIESKIIRRATDEEKQLLLDKMHESGKDWDSEHMEIVDYKWKPKEGESFYGILFNQDTYEFEYFFDMWHGTNNEENMWRRGWVFKNIENQDSVLESLSNRLNNAIKNVK